MTNCHILPAVRFITISPWSHSALGQMYERQNRFEAAMRLYEELLLIQPNNRYAIDGIKRIKKKRRTKR